MSEGGEATNVKVMVRMRLFNSREINESKQKKEKLRPVVRMRGNTCCILEYITDDRGFTTEREREAFAFDECFWSMPDEQGMADQPYATQEHVYSKSGLLAMNAAFEGFNVCIFAYGQTGSGKTYSMLGYGNDPGISPRICDDLFIKMQRVSQETMNTTKCQLACTFFEIYNEKVRDLFNKKTKVGHYDAPKIRQHPTRGVYVDGLMHKEVSTAEEAKSLIEKGTNERAMAETKMNKHSSRSHAVFQLQLTQLDAMKGTQKVATINLVDLAGSEKIKKSEAEGMTFTEATNINKSLSTLRRVIDTLIENSQSKRQKVAPFRESVLTYTLSDSLGGNSKTQMIATISPHVSNLEDTIGTLRYALRAKDIVCNAKVNEEESAAMVDAMRDEIENLKRKMRSGGGGGGVAMLPEEIEKEIKMREAEVAKMEANMAEALDEYKEKEAELQKEIEEKNREQMALSTAVSNQKRERFAAAFRNAFTIHQDKKKIAQSAEELEDAQKRAVEAEQQRQQMAAELDEKLAEATSLRHERDNLQVAFDDLKSTSEDEHQKLTRSVEEITTLSRSLEQQLEKITVECEKAKRDQQESEERVLRMQEDMVGLTHAVEREQTEKGNVTMAFEEAALRSNKVIEAARRRKEKYKQLHGEEETRTAALRAAIDAHSHDRKSLLETIKAQQRLLDEKDFLLKAANKAHDEAKEKARHFEELAERRRIDIEQLMESLREYQGASSKWMMEHTVMEKEVARLRLSQDRSRYHDPIMGSVASPLAPMSPLATTPRRSQSPTASRARSPFFRQPRVERVLSTNSNLSGRANWKSPAR